jgi:hypothetical protein
LFGALLFPRPKYFLKQHNPLKILFFKKEASIRYQCKTIMSSAFALIRVFPYLLTRLIPFTFSAFMVKTMPKVQEPL